MAHKKRKRSHLDAAATTESAYSTKSKSPVKRDLLEQCYAQVHTFRQYLLGKLPSSSRLRRKKIAAIGSHEARLEIEVELANLLDNVLICSTEPAESEARELRWQQWLNFSQQNGDESYVTISGTPEAASHFQTGVGIASKILQRCTTNLGSDCRLRHLASLYESKIEFMAKASPL